MSLKIELLSLLSNDLLTMQLSRMRELLKQYLIERKMVVYEVVTYRRWSLTRSGHYERVDCTNS